MMMIMMMMVALAGRLGRLELAPKVARRAELLARAGGAAVVAAAAIEAARLRWPN